VKIFVQNAEILSIKQPAGAVTVPLTVLSPRRFGVPNVRMTVSGLSRVKGLRNTFRYFLPKEGMSYTCISGGAERARSI
jgi:hypothetical protein